MSPSRVRRTIKGRLSVVVACLLIVAASSPGAAVAAPAKASGDGSWIVSLRAGSDVAAAKRTARGAGGSVGLTFSHALHGFAFKGSAAAANALRNNPRVLAVVPDRALALTETLPYGIKRIDAHVPGSSDGAYQAGYRGAGTRIAIIDTGIDLDHPDLAAHVDATGGKNCVTSGAPPNDGHGHGSHVAGTAAAPLNGVGVVGVAPEATLVPIKVFDDAGNSSESMVLCGIDYATGLNTEADPDNDIDVASMSFGEARAWGDCVTDPLHTAICNKDSGQKEQKSDRLAAALRANLARRKAQKRARDAAARARAARNKDNRQTMDSILVHGGQRLQGAIPISGAKNACLTLMPAALLTDEPVTLTNAPRLSDIRTMTTLLESLGCEVASLQQGRVLVIGTQAIASHRADYEIVRKMRASILVLGPMLARDGHAVVSLPGGCAIGARPVDLHLQGPRGARRRARPPRRLRARRRAPNGLQGRGLRVPAASRSAPPRTC